MARFAVVVAAAACLVGAPAQEAAENCHADLLIHGIQISQLTMDQKRSVSQLAAQKIAAATGHTPQDVRAMVFPGNYDAPWSPSAGRPNSDLFLATLVNNCNANAVLESVENPQLHQQLLSAMQAALSGSGALSGALKVEGSSVVPQSMAEQMAAQTPQAGGGGGLTLPAVPPGTPTDSSFTGGHGGAGSGSSGGGSFGAMIGFICLVLVGGAVVGFIVMSKRGKRYSEESDEENGPFTGH